MQTIEAELLQISCRPDLFVQNSQGETVMWVEVTATHRKNPRVRQSSRPNLSYYLKASNNSVPFAMRVDLDKIEIFHGRDVDLSQPLSSLPTAAVLISYGPNLSEKDIFSPYLAALVEAWLRDLAYNWKSDRPPAFEEMDNIGLLALIENGTTRSGDSMSGDRLY